MDERRVTDNINDEFEPLKIFKGSNSLKISLNVRDNYSTSKVKTKFF